MSRRAINVILLIMTITLLGVSVSEADAAKGTPQLVIPSPRHDAGSHWEGETVSHTFEVKNGGTAELKILKVKPG